MSVGSSAGLDSVKSSKAENKVMEGIIFKSVINCLKSNESVPALAEIVSSSTSDRLIEQDDLNDSDGNLDSTGIDLDELYSHIRTEQEAKQIDEKRFLSDVMKKPEGSNIQ